MVAIRSPRPIRAVQRARLWAIVWTASQAQVGGEAARGEMVQPDAVLEVAVWHSRISGWRRMVRHQFEPLPVPVGDEAVIAVTWVKRASWEPGVRLHPPDDEQAYRRERLTSAWKGRVGGLGHIGGTVHPVRNRRTQASSGIASDEIVQAFVLAWMVMEKRNIHLAADGDHGVGIEAAVRHAW